MADGRPAFAWWNEIQMLRKEVSSKSHKEQKQYLEDWARVLKVIEAHQWQSIEGDIHIVVKHSKIASARTPQELIEAAELATPTPAIQEMEGK